MKIALPKPVNDVQSAFAELCAKGGGVGGGPPRTKVQELLRAAGQELNKLAESEIEYALKRHSHANPWIVCFVVAICWGHLARLNDEFLDGAIGFLTYGRSADLSKAMAQYNERRPGVIENSLGGARTLFGTLTMPTALSDSLAGMRKVQERWLGRIVAKDRPAYIGSWNGTAMFMVALFAQPKLGDQLLEQDIALPPGGPIFGALTMLHRVHVMSRGPEGSELDDQSFEPGAIFANTGLMAELRRGRDDWDLLDVHSGLYMLGTRDPASKAYFQ